MEALATSPVDVYALFIDNSDSHVLGNPVKVRQRFDLFCIEDHDPDPFCCLLCSDGEDTVIAGHDDAGKFNPAPSGGIIGQKPTPYRHRHPTVERFSTNHHHSI